jgi:hypothetical protein
MASMREVVAVAVREEMEKLATHNQLVSAFAQRHAESLASVQSSLRERVRSHEQLMTQQLHGLVQSSEVSLFSSPSPPPPDRA